MHNYANYEIRGMGIHLKLTEGIKGVRTRPVTRPVAQLREALEGSRLRASARRGRLATSLKKCNTPRCIRRYHPRLRIAINIYIMACNQVCKGLHEIASQQLKKTLVGGSRPYSDHMDPFPRK